MMGKKAGFVNCVMLRVKILYVSESCELGKQ